MPTLYCLLLGLAFELQLGSLVPLFILPTMATPSPSPRSPYLEFQAELEQILKHKWLVSEKAGRDVGFERALMEWVGKNRHQWRLARNKAAAKN
jgi:hypothetical protein